MTSPLSDLVKEFARLTRHLEETKLELQDAKTTMDFTLEQLWSLRETLHETIETDYGVRFSTYEFGKFMEAPERVMVMLHGKVRVFENEAAIDPELEDDERIHAADFFFEG